MNELMQKILNDEALEKEILDELATYRKKIQDFKTRSKLQERWDHGYQLYKNKPDIYDTKEEWQANVCVPWVFQYVETIVPRIVNAVYGVYPLFDCVGEYAEADLRSDKSERVLNSILYSEEFFNNFVSAIKACAVFGTAWLKYVVTNKYGRTMVYPEYCDPYTVGIETTARHPYDARYMYHDIYRPEWHLMEKADEGIYHNIEKMIQNRQLQCNETPSHLERLADVGLAPYNEKSDEVKLTEWYVTMKEPRSGEFKNMIFTEANESRIIRAEENEYNFKPFERVVMIPFPDEMYGISIPQIIEFLVYEGNEKRNQILDANNLMINPVFQMVNHALADDDEFKDLVFGPGEIIQVSVMDAIKPIQQNFQALAAGYQDLQVTEKAIQDAVGIFDYNRGAPKAGDQTATEIVSLINEGNMRFLMMIFNLEHGVLKNVARRTLQLMKSYMAYSEPVKMMRPDIDKAGKPKIIREFEQIKKSDIEHDLDIKCMASAAYNQRVIETQNLLQFIEMIRNDPESMQFMDKRKLYKMVARSLNIKDLSFFKSEDELGEDGLPNSLTPEMVAGMANRGATGMVGPGGGLLGT